MILLAHLSQRASILSTDQNSFMNTHTKSFLTDSLRLVNLPSPTHTIAPRLTILRSIRSNWATRRHSSISPTVTLGELPVFFFFVLFRKDSISYSSQWLAPFGWFRHTANGSHPRTGSDTHLMASLDTSCHFVLSRSYVASTFSKNSRSSLICGRYFRALTVRILMLSVLSPSCFRYVLACFLSRSVSIRVNISNLELLETV